MTSSKFVAQVLGSWAQANAPARCAEYTKPSLHAGVEEHPKEPWEERVRDLVNNIDINNNNKNIIMEFYSD